MSIGADHSRQYAERRVATFATTGPSKSVRTCHSPFDHPRVFSVMRFTPRQSRYLKPTVELGTTWVWRFSKYQSLNGEAGKPASLKSAAASGYSANA